MPTEIDSLQIKINAEATKANTAIDNLITRLDTLTTSITGLNGDNLYSFARGTRELGNAVQLFKDTKSVDFRRIADGISRFSAIDTSNLSTLSNGLGTLSVGLTSISSIDNLGNVTKVVNALRNLSSVDMSKFNVESFGLIGNSIRDFASSLVTVGSVDKNIVSLVNAVSRLSASGKSIENVSREFPGIASQIVDFVNRLNGLNINFDVSGVGSLIANIRNLGGKTATNAITTIPQLATALNGLMLTLSKAPQVSTNVIQMTQALANLSAQGSKVGNATNSITRGLNRASTSATRANFSFKSLAAIFGTFYANAFLLIRGIKGLNSAIESTADYIEAFNYFNVALGKIGEDWEHQFEEYGYDSAEAYADSFSTRLKDRLKGLSGLNIELGADGTGLLSETGLQNLGLNIQEVTQYASQLASVTNSVGQVGEVSLASASALTKLGADISSLFNIDYADVMGNLNSALIGQSRSVYKYGIDITNATLQTYAYGLGLSKSVSEMTQMEKMQLRLIAILDQSKVSWGDLANTINSPSNMMRQFSNNAKELGMVLGQLFIPALQRVMPVLNGATIAIKRLLVSLANLLGIKLDLDAFGQGFTGLEEDTEGLSDSLDDVAKSAEKAYMGLLGFDKLNVIKTPEDTQKATGGASGDTIDLTKEILAATEEYEAVWQRAFDDMENRAQEFADTIERIFKPITDPFKDMINNIRLGGWTQAGMYAGDVVTNIFKSATKALEEVDWDGIGNNIGLFLKGIEWANIFKSVGNFIETMWDSAWELFKTAFRIDSMGKLISSLLVGYFAVKTISITPKILIAGVTWEVFSRIGNELGKILFPEDAYFYENFSWFDEGGFFDTVFGDIDSVGDAIERMGQSWTATNNAIMESPVLSALQFILNPANWTIRLLIYNAQQFDPEVFKETMRSMWEDIVFIWDDFQNTLFEDYTEPFLDGIVEAWGGLVGFFEELWDNITKVWNDAQDWLFDNVTEPFIDGLINKFEKLGDAIQGLFGSNSNSAFSGFDIAGGIGGNIKGYATGGFPSEYSLFMAGEHGHAEMLGTVGGKTAVAGGAEITGIREEIRSTANEEIALLRQQNALLQGILEKEFGISTDAVGRATQSWARDYSRRTGRPAFN